ncbi:MAG: porin [Candidatus Methylumidiphilus sp.]
MKPVKLALAVTALLGACYGQAQALDLYVDTKTKQLFAEPGRGRVKLGTFEQVSEPDKGAKETKRSVQEIERSLDQQKAELTAMETRLDKKKDTMKAVEKKIDTAAAMAPASTEKKWYDKLSIRGYGQLRYSQLLGNHTQIDRTQLMTPTDRSVGQNQDLLLRRARLVVSGDITDYMYIYLQGDMSANIAGNTAPSTSDSTSQGNFFQMRDYYADIFFDKAHEYRIRAGQSKVPFMWENLQSSQNRVSFERADAINSTAVRDERDLGIWAMWTPDNIQQRFKYLQKSGLKGSGDYGVVALGTFNGQGANRFEFNDAMHLGARVTYPFELPLDQILEVGASGFFGRYNPSTTAYVNQGRTIAAPIQVGNTPLNTGRGYDDSRYGFHAILYPKPFGLQTEWTWGRVPTLDLGNNTLASKGTNGGYVMAMYKLDHFYGTWVPYAKWEMNRGGSKFDYNSPYMFTEQVEVGVEWQPRPEFEITAAYAYMDRTNLSAGSLSGIPGLKTTSSYQRAVGDVLRLQLQYNY